MMVPFGFLLCGVASSSFVPAAHRRRSGCLLSFCVVEAMRRFDRMNHPRQSIRWRKRHFWRQQKFLSRLSKQLLFLSIQMKIEAGGSVCEERSCCSKFSTERFRTGFRVHGGYESKNEKRCGTDLDSF